jgi:hypothetical protein
MSPAPDSNRPRRAITEIEKMNYRDLRLIDADNNETTIGEAIDRAISLRECSEFDERYLTLARAGRVDSWDGYFIAAVGEDPDWDTPRCVVDWSGFAEAVAEIRSNAD